MDSVRICLLQTSTGPVGFYQSSAPEVSEISPAPLAYLLTSRQLIFQAVFTCVSLLLFQMRSLSHSEVCSQSSFYNSLMLTFMVSGLHLLLFSTYHSTSVYTSLFSLQVTVTSFQGIFCALVSKN